MPLMRTFSAFWMIKQILVIVTRMRTIPQQIFLAGKEDTVALVDIVPPSGVDRTKWTYRNVLYEVIGQGNEIWTFGMDEVLIYPGWDKQKLKKIFTAWMDSDVYNAARTDYEKHYQVHQREEQYKIVSILNHVLIGDPDLPKNEWKVEYIVRWLGDTSDPGDAYLARNEADPWIRPWEVDDPNAATGLHMFWRVPHEELEETAPARLYKYWRQHEMDHNDAEWPLVANEVLEWDEDELFEDGNLASGITDFKEAMASNAYRYSGKLVDWAQSPVYADPVLAVMVHWREPDRHSMSELSAHIVKAHLGEYYISSQLYPLVEWIDVEVSETGVRWMKKGEDIYSSISPIDGLQRATKELARNMKKKYKKQFNIVMTVDVHSNWNDGEMLFNRGRKHHSYGTPLEITKSVFGDIKPREVSVRSVCLLLTCSGTVLQALDSVQETTVAFHSVVAFTAKQFNAQRVSEQFLPPFLRGYLQDRKTCEEAMLLGYVKELASTELGLDMFLFEAMSKIWRFTYATPARNFTGNPEDLNCPLCSHYMQMDGKRNSSGLLFRCRIRGCKGRVRLSFENGQFGVYELYPRMYDTDFRVLKIEVDTKGPGGSVRICPPPRPIDPKWLTPRS
ncbi:hypothetical protein CALCODRAFT_488820 [Calocera cornea HHB12733]|uniref:Uncharacterized protein n=1 Tax=Calocera cornea HHB12733 TaxID=1353952 RepID=A0A165C672_9BASI|nr:hypothetical protein CALCODRAFT_488820 [Calocera cornea HHB12733]